MSNSYYQQSGQNYGNSYQMQGGGIHDEQIKLKMDQYRQTDPKYSNQYKQQQQNQWNEKFDDESQKYSDEDERSLDDEFNNHQSGNKNSNGIRNFNTQQNNKQSNQKQKQQTQQYDPHQKYTSEYYQEQYFRKKNEGFQQQQQQYQNNNEQQHQKIKNNNNNEAEFIDIQLELNSTDNRQYIFQESETEPLPPQQVNSQGTGTGGEMVPLLRFNNNLQRFEFNSKIQELLDRFQGKYQFVVLVGNQQSQKEEFLKNLLNENENITIQENQSGIWIYSEPLYDRRENIYTFFLNCQNFQQNQASFIQDIRILSFATMISSYILYFSDQGLELATIHQMDFLTKLSQHIHVDQQNENQSQQMWEDDLAITYYLPVLGILFKDFAVINSKIDLNIEFEQVLATSSREHKVELTKQFIKKFKDRESFGISRLQEQGSKKDLHQFKEKLKQRGTYKEINGIALKGRMIFNLCAYCSQQLNTQNCRLNYEQAWNYIVKNECVFGYNTAVESFQLELKKYFSQDISRRFEDLYFVMKEIRENTLQRFHQIAGIRQKNQFYSNFKMDLVQKINTMEVNIINKNDELAINQNKDQLLALVAPMKEKLETPGGYTLSKLNNFIEDLSEILTQYDQQGVGSNKAECLIEFLQEFHPQIINRMIEQIQEKYQDESEIQGEDPTQYEEQIPILEQKIEEHERNIQKFEKEREDQEVKTQSLQGQINNLKQQQKQEEQKERKINNLLDIKKKNENTIGQMNREIGELKKQNKGCCGCFG